MAPDDGPLLTRHTLAEARAVVSPPGPTPGPVPKSGTPLAPRRILLVEDNAVNQMVASRMLERLGCRVDVAGNGKEAVEMTLRFPYDLVFMDWRMPVMDGLEATAEIRRRGGPRVPIVAMTANAMEGDAELCLAAGMDDYVSKPIARPELERVLDAWAPRAAQPMA